MTTARSYLDPVYDRFEQSAAQQTGVDPAMLRAIRTQGERSNSDQVSPAGARTVYQIIPQTRAGLIKNYGVDPYASDDSAALGAALLLKEGLQRNRGNAQAAIGEYHGGIDRRNWGPVNAGYRARVGGGGMPAARSVLPDAQQYVATPNDDAMQWPDAQPAQGAQPVASGQSATPDTFASIYQTGGASSTPAAPAASPSRDANNLPDYSGWLDSYIRNVLKNV